MKKRFFLLFVMVGLLITLASCAASNKYVKLTLDSDYYEVYKGQTIELLPEVNKGSSVGEVIIEYSSYDESIATYTDGKLQGVEYGETIIKVVYAGNATICDVAKVVVIEHDLASEADVDVTPVELYESDSYVVPCAEALEVVYTFESSNNDVATVDENGKVTATLDGALHNDGKVVITVTASDVYGVVEDIYFDVEVTVKEAHYAISYDLAGGSFLGAYADEYDVHDLPFTLPVPEKKGYTFAGWKLNGEGEAVYAIPAATEGAVKYTAQWTPNKYALTYDLVGGTNAAENPVEHEYDAEIVLKAPVKVGYTFIGWDATGVDFVLVDKEAQTYSFVSKVANALEITAKWSENTYNVTYVLNGATTNENAASFKYSEGLTLVPAVKVGYTFNGWYTTEDFKAGTEITGVDANCDAPADLKVYAKFTVNQYTITFDCAGGTTVAPITLDYDLPVTAPVAPTKEGYTFVGWDKEVPARMPANDLTLTAKWSENTYNVTYVLNGATTNANPDTFKYSEGLTLVAAVKVGYTFNGWYTTEDFKAGSEFVEIAANSYTGDGVKVYAKFTVNQYTITFDCAGGTAVAPIIKDYDAAVTAPAAPTKEGYTFAGWDKEVPTRMPAENLMLTAKWTINSYTITFESNGGTEVAAITLAYGATITAPTAPTKVGYTFADWDQAIPATMPAENKTISAKWTINSYTITFENEDGTPYAVLTQDYNTAVVAPTDPTKVGYTFAGWDKEVPATMPAENLTFKATWTINSYTITFESNGGTDVAAITLAYGATITAPVAPTKVGYTFAGWDQAIPATMPAENKTIAATWTINTYKITFVNSNGTPHTVLTQDYNTAVVAPTAPTKDYYEFAGWDKEVPATMPAEDLTITATWTPVVYNIKYVGVPATATNANPTTYTIESEDITLVDLVAEHYDFLGWFADSSLTVAFTGITACSNGDVTVYCSLTASKYTIKYVLPKNAYFYAQGNTTANVVEYEYSEEVVLETPNLPGHSFVGWYNNAEFNGEPITKIEVGTSGTQTFYPKFKEITYVITFVVAPVAGLPTSSEGEMKEIAGLEAPESVEFTISSPAVVFEKLEAAGYEFVGWFFVHENQLVKLVGNFLPSNQYGDISFYALWK